jgi:Ca2+-binding RTX toxin-like protein
MKSRRPENEQIAAWRLISRPHDLRQGKRNRALDLFFERTTTMSLSGNFNPVTGVVTVFGDNAKNTITLNRDAAGSILINGGAVPIIGGKPTVAGTNLIQVFGLAGNDIISIDETNGAMPQILSFGGDSNDTLTGGSGDDQLFGQAGDDALLGRAATIRCLAATAMTR